jgi:hypothetical protein
VAVKQTWMEPHSADELERTISGYYAAIKSGKGALYLAVCRGKVLVPFDGMFQGLCGVSFGSLCTWRAVQCCLDRMHGPDNACDQIVELLRRCQKASTLQMGMRGLLSCLASLFPT